MRDAANIAGVFTLVREPLTDWPMVDVPGPVMWLRALAVDPGYRGRDVGRIAVNAALAQLDKGEPLYLDCVCDFLPDYYARSGFRAIATQTRTYDSGEIYDLILMRHDGAA